MRTSLHSNERIILSSQARESRGKADEFFPKFAPGDLTLTSERLIFEAEKTGDAPDLEIGLGQIRAVSSGWIRMIDLVPIYPCLEVRGSDGRVHRLTSVGQGGFQPGTWCGAIPAAQANLPEDARPALETQAVGETGESAGSLPPPPHPTDQGFMNEASPPLKPDSAPVDDRLAWAVAAVPLAGAVFEYMAGSSIPVLLPGFLMLAANVVLTQIDIRKMTSAGHEAPNGWWALLVPVYLWKRAAILQRSQIITFAWAAAFAIALVVGLSNDKARLADAACPVVTDIIRNQLNGETTCRRVTITEDLGGGLYTARATLANGNSIRITIEERGSDIYVQIPQQ